VDVSSFHEIIENVIQLLFAGFRITTALYNRSHITIVLLLAHNQQFDQLRRIDERKGASISTTILIENTSKGLTTYFDLWDKLIPRRRMRHYLPPWIGYATILYKQAYLRRLMKVKGKTCTLKKQMVCLSRRIQYRQQSEGSFMPDTYLQTSEGAIDEQPSIVENPDLEMPIDEDTQELDLALEEELIIEDFTIDGICGVY
jgi:mycofactocin precursor